MFLKNSLVGKSVVGKTKVLWEIGDWENLGHYNTDHSLAKFPVFSLNTKIL
jgi:hypothetical protein